VVIAMRSYPALVASLVLVHGFTQNRKCWGSLTTTLAEGAELVAVDAPGHGAASAVRADLWEAADLLAKAASGTYLGYSMGARMVLHVALAHPDQVERLVLVSGTAGIEAEAERAARVERDEQLACSLERDGLDAFLERWLAQPLFATLPERARDDEERRENTVEGLASSLRLAGTGTQEPLWARLPDLEMPVLLVAGALDARFTENALRMAATIGSNATLRVMPDAGHACHREREDEFSRLVLDWLAQGT
jgi:2-succinyl-6-hydroxy-2,4-cyclohexadiene-1-carboxylate synthase